MTELPVKKKFYPIVIRDNTKAAYAKSLTPSEDKGKNCCFHNVKAASVQDAAKIAKEQHKDLKNKLGSEVGSICAKNLVKNRDSYKREVETRAKVIKKKQKKKENNKKRKRNETQTKKPTKKPSPPRPEGSNKKFEDLEKRVKKLEDIVSESSSSLVKDLFYGEPKK